MCLRMRIPTVMPRRTPGRLRLRVALPVACVLLVFPAAVRAQCSSYPTTVPALAPSVRLDPGCRSPSDRHDWGGEISAFLVNAALGGLTAGLSQTWRGGDFTDALLRGAVGGAVGYGGKRLAAEPFDGAGFLGRQVASFGNSFVRNAADGIPLLDRLYVPLYLVRLEIRARPEGTHVQPRLDVMTTAGTIYGLLQSDASFDAGSTLSAGAVVFRTPADLTRIYNTQGTAVGQTIGGFILLAERADRSPADHARTFAHERVHTLQFDQSLAYWASPLESWALERMGASGLARWLDFNVASSALGLLAPVATYDALPWEMEAEWLTR